MVDLLMKTKHWAKPFTVSSVYNAAGTRLLLLLNKGKKL